MACLSVYYVCMLLCLQSFVIGCLSFDQQNILDIKVLNVGKELEMESLPLKMGQRLYKLHGLKESMFYEVKISYPASIPASFSIELKKDMRGLHLGKNRRLLNTEKLIFKAGFDESDSGDLEKYVLVTVEAAGIVAKPGVLERESVLFNIVCDELPFGIPHKAWCVVVVAVLCLVLAFIVPHFLPSDFLVINQLQQSNHNLEGRKVS